MSSATPPPLPRTPEWALITYAQAAVYLAPTMFFGTFWLIHSVPKIDRIWQTTGLVNTKLGFLIGAVRFFEAWGPPIMAGIVFLILLLEWRARFWPSWRRPVVVIVTMAITMTMTLALLLTATSSLISADYVVSREKHFREKLQQSDKSE